MKSKIYTLLTILTLVFCFSFSASSTSSEELPNWVEVNYSDLNTDAISEYQLVTVTVQNHGLWLGSNNYNVSVDYDQNQLKLVNTVYIDSAGNKQVREGSVVTSSDNNFKVSYQFYLQPNVSLETVPLTVSKVKNNDQREQATVSLNTHSYTTNETIKFGKIRLGYTVTTYTNDGTNIEYNAHFKVVSNPDKEEFTLSLKPNTMNVSSSDIYDVKLRFNDGVAKAIDKNNFSLNMNAGDQFDLNVTSTVEGLSAKDDRFDFLIYLQSGDDFARITPKFYRSELITDQANTRLHKYVLIKIVIVAFFICLTGLFIISDKRVAKRTKGKRKKRIKAN